MPTTTKPRPVHPFADARRMKPTQKHRLAIWECMLATVYARNAAGEVRYFDYDWDAARAFAGVTPEADPRVWKQSHAVSVGDGQTVYKGQTALYLKRS